MPVYRDDHDALRLRATALRQEVARCEARVTAAFWRCIPDDDAEALRRARREGDAHDTTRDAHALAAACEAYERYVRRFERLLAEMEHHERAWRAVSDEDMLPSSVPLEVARVTASAHPLVRAFVDAVRLVDPMAALESSTTENEFEYVHDARASLRLEGAPLAMHLVARGVGDEGTHVLELRATTTVPRGVPAVLARPETWVESLFRGLRRRGVGGDDSRFDAFFHVECASGERERVLTPTVREAMLVIAAVDVPTLHVAPPVATLRWRYAPSAPTLLAAARCMAALRGASVLPLLKG